MNGNNGKTVGTLSSSPDSRSADTKRSNHLSITEVLALEATCVLTLFLQSCRLALLGSIFSLEFTQTNSFYLQE